MSETWKTFPSYWEEKNAGKSGSYFNGGLRMSDNVEIGNPNPLYLNERERVLASLENNKNRDRLLLRGGWYSTYPKFQPAGSFNRPYNVNGNTYYGNGNQLVGSGLLRTKEVQDYYDKILQQRKEQLDAMVVAQETGQDLVPRPSEPIEGEADEITSKLQAMISNVYNRFFGSEFDKMSVSEISDIYTILLKKGIILPNNVLLEFYQQMSEISETIGRALSTPDIAERFKNFIVLLPRGAGINFFKITILLKVLIGVKKLSLPPKDSQTVVNSWSKKILRLNNANQLKDLGEEIDLKLQPQVPRLSSEEVQSNAERILGRLRTKIAVNKGLTRLGAPERIDIEDASQQFRFNPRNLQSLIRRRDRILRELREGEADEIDRQEALREWEEIQRQIDEEEARREAEEVGATEIQRLVRGRQARQEAQRRREEEQRRREEEGATAIQRLERGRQARARRRREEEGATAIQRLERGRQARARRRREEEARREFRDLTGEGKKGKGKRKGKFVSRLDLLMK
jgi:hypothetical protein